MTTTDPGGQGANGNGGAYSGVLRDLPKWARGWVSVALIFGVPLLILFPFLAREFGFIKNPVHEALMLQAREMTELSDAATKHNEQSEKFLHNLERQVSLIWMICRNSARTVEDRVECGTAAAGRERR